jgi:hypothetical protein
MCWGLPHEGFSRVPIVFQKGFVRVPIGRLRFNRAHTAGACCSQKARCWAPSTHATSTRPARSVCACVCVCTIPPPPIPTVNGNTVRSFSTHGQQPAAKGSSTAVSCSDVPGTRHCWTARACPSRGGRGAPWPSGALRAQPAWRRGLAAPPPPGKKTPRKIVQTLVL